MRLPFCLHTETFLARALTAVALASLVAACSRSAPPASEASITELRQRAAESQDGELRGELLLRELLAPGGSAQRAAKTRDDLDDLPAANGMLASVARGLDDALHGRLAKAPEQYLTALQAARESDDARAPYLAWFAAHQATRLAPHAPELFERWSTAVKDLVAKPGNIGWRARIQLVDWWVGEAWPDANGKAEALAVRELGCVPRLRLAGPFGHDTAADVLRHFPAEAPGPWPQQWESDEGVVEAPRVLETERHGCWVSAAAPTGSGVFYGEAYVELSEAQDLIIAMPGAFALWIDDRLMLDRDPRIWGIWPKFGVAVRLGAGQHRILGRLTDAETSLRVMHLDGRPARIASRKASALPYTLTPPQPLQDPNLVSRHIVDGAVRPPRGDLLRFVVSYLANVEGQGDVANVLMEPLLEDLESATGPALLMSAEFTANDPIFESSQVRDLIHELHRRAVAKDDRLFQARLELVSWKAEQGGLADAVGDLERLSRRFRGVPQIGLALAHVYDQLGWKPEHHREVLELLARFPEDLDVLHAAIDVLEDQGQPARAKRLAARVVKLDPDSELGVERALNRLEYSSAIDELQRLAARRPSEDGFASRIDALRHRAAFVKETWSDLQRAIADEPDEAAPRLELADAEVAAGKEAALTHALADAVAHGAPAESLEAALDLTAGMSELAPFRLDSRQVIADYEAQGRHLAGTAARILDYSAIWVRSDGSSRMLEHEIVRMQSAEAVRRFAEHPRLDGLVLNMRVIKADGSELLPEFVSGKPTVTMPHLEVGDYIDTEHVMSLTPSNDGALYVGPRWYFREADVAYARSEFVVISPAHQQLTIETRGGAPAPTIERERGATVYRWRVDESPAAPVEPLSVPASDWLPSVRPSWGVTLDQHLHRLAAQVLSLTPVDPRVKRIAAGIVRPTKPEQAYQRARMLYRWVLENVEPGEESDGRRVVIAKQGSRWQGFMTLCRALELPVTVALARNTLSDTPVGPVESAEQFNLPLLRVQTERGDTWLTMGQNEARDRYLPFGYLPPGVRETEAWTMDVARAKNVFTPTSPIEDHIAYDGKLALDKSGKASGTLVFRFSGRYGMDLRAAHAQLPTSRWRDVLESELVGKSLRGAILKSHELAHLDDFNAPFEVRARVEIPAFARRTEQGLVIEPPFNPRLSQLATLPARKTAFLLGSPVDHSVALRIELPAGAAVASPALQRELEFGEQRVTIADKIVGGALELHRTIALDALRLPPERYPEFARFVQQSDALLSAAIRVKP